jgi:nucleoside-diphosphate-sugar epimerase
MLRNAIIAAEATGARQIYPGSLYVYGPDAGEVVAEVAPQHPSKGSIRVEMEAMLHAAAVRGLCTLVVRAGDYFGPRAPSSWVSTILLQGGKPRRNMVTPERSDVGHAWAYLPDLAETVALLADAKRRCRRRSGCISAVTTCGVAAWRKPSSAWWEARCRSSRSAGCRCTWTRRSSPSCAR